MDRDIDIDRYAGASSEPDSKAVDIKKMDIDDLKVSVLI